MSAWVHDVETRSYPSEEHVHLSVGTLSAEMAGDQPFDIGDSYPACTFSRFIEIKFAVNARPPALRRRPP